MSVLQKWKNLKYRGSSLALALVFTFIFWLNRYEDFQFGGAVFALITAGFFVLTFTALLFLYNRLDRLPARPDGTPEKRRRMLCLCGFLVVWGGYYLFSCPGHIIHDSGSSILYGLGINQTNENNPFFQNILFGGVYKLGVLLGHPNRGVALYCALQSLGYIALLTYMLRRIKNRTAFLTLIVLYLLIPAFPIMSMTMAKDANFALALLAYTCLLTELVRDPQAFMEDRKKPVLLAGTVILAGLMRNNAVYVLLAVPACRILFAYRQRKGRLYVLTLCALSLLFCVVLPNTTGISKVQIKQSLSVPIQQTGYYYKHYKDEITPEEREKLSSVIDPEALDDYIEDIVDPIKRAFKRYPSREDLRDYFSVWYAQMKKHPGAYLKAFYLHTNGYYTPSADKSYVKPHTVTGFVLDEQIYERSELTKNKNPGLRFVYGMDKYALKIPVLSLFSKIGIYTWLMLIALVRLFQKKRYAELMCYTAPLMVFIGCLLSPVNGYFRYAFPMVLCVPLLFVQTTLPQEEKNEN